MRESDESAKKRKKQGGKSEGGTQKKREERCRDRGYFGNRRSSNYYGFSGSNSPDGNTTQFTHADCSREDVNSCQCRTVHFVPSHSSLSSFFFLSSLLFLTPTFSIQPSCLSSLLSHSSPPLVSRVNVFGKKTKKKKEGGKRRRLSVRRLFAFPLSFHLSL